MFSGSLVLQVNFSQRTKIQRFEFEFKEGFFYSLGPEDGCRFIERPMGSEI
ncbi:hypothetical protein LEP1GSC038_1748 [Leptospira weilii str. 2006001855]|uniref:Uncharacterized protein n=2 Tax=Leptospira weilii TaxID=28184 RepID=M6FUA8_9LEPT|nr:hypothetical protein LEP1GSC038_1748 [Leptospira weilii str. 2006001855]